jgi:hypothetical protein
MDVNKTMVISHEILDTLEKNHILQVVLNN